MDVAWYEREEVKDRLMVFGRAVQGRDPYEIDIKPEPANCHGGCCSFAERRITVNPVLFSVPPQEQYHLTKALLVHEAGHRRYTTLPILPEPAREIANIVEDERVERRMCQEFVGVRWLIDRLARQFYTQSRRISAQADSPSEIICYVLHLRWATRIEQPIKGQLSPRNQLLWKRIEPLVYESWDADCSGVVSRNAVAIAEALGLINVHLVIQTNHSTEEVV